MDNNENQVLEIESTTEEVGLFDDIDVAEEESTPAETEAEAEPSVVKETKPQEPFLKIRYNKEDRGLSLEEATELAQKGMNYDNIYSKYNTLNSQLERLAKINGMDIQSYLKTLDDTQVQFEMDKEVRSLKKQYPNSDEALLNEIAQQRVNAKLSNNVKAVEEQRISEENAEQEVIKRQVEVFNKHYPNLEADKLDPKVYEYMQDGYTLLEAYSLFKETKLAENDKQAEKSAKVKAQNDANKMRSLGNISTSGAATADDFLSGFLNG